MNKKYLILLLGLLISSLYCFAGTRDPYTPDEKYIEYGAKFTNVVMVYGKEHDGTMFNGSAVVIDDHHVLTAAHMVHNASECFVLIDKQNFKLVEIICHKNFDNNKPPKSDIALGYCDKKFGLTFYPELYSKNDEAKKVCSIAGFGMTGTFKEGANHSDLKRRAGSNIIDKTEDDMIICSPSLNFKKTELEFLIASGDSGGGLFIDGKLAGINSFIMCDKGLKLNSDYFSESAHTRVSNYVEWIRENTKSSISTPLHNR